MTSGIVCPHCGLLHNTTCTRIKSIKYWPDGTTKRIDFHPPIPPEITFSSMPLLTPPESPPPSELQIKKEPVINLVLNGKRLRPLSLTEIKVVQLLAEGASNKTIARALDIAESTVKVHVKSILRKTHVQNRTQAALWYMDQPSSRLHESPTTAIIRPDGEAINVEGLRCQTMTSTVSSSTP